MSKVERVGFAIALDSLESWWGGGFTRFALRQTVELG